MDMPNEETLILANLKVMAPESLHPKIKFLSKRKSETLFNQLSAHYLKKYHFIPFPLPHVTKEKKKSSPMNCQTLGDLPLNRYSTHFERRNLRSLKTIIESNRMSNDRRANRNLTIVDTLNRTSLKSTNLQKFNFSRNDGAIINSRSNIGSRLNTARTIYSSRPSMAKSTKDQLQFLKTIEQMQSVTNYSQNKLRITPEMPRKRQAIMKVKQTPLTRQEQWDAINPEQLKLHIDKKIARSHKINYLDKETVEYFLNEVGQGMIRNSGIKSEYPLYHVIPFSKKLFSNPRLIQTLEDLELEEGEGYPKYPEWVKIDPKKCIELKFIHELFHGLTREDFINIKKLLELRDNKVPLTSMNIKLTEEPNSKLINNNKDKEKKKKSEEHIKFKVESGHAKRSMAIKYLEAADNLRGGGGWPDYKQGVFMQMPEFEDKGEWAGYTSADNKGSDEDNSSDQSGLGENNPLLLISKAATPPLQKHNLDYATKNMTREEIRTQIRNNTVLYKKCIITEMTKKLRILKENFDYLVRREELHCFDRQPSRRKIGNLGAVHNRMQSNIGLSKLMNRITGGRSRHNIGRSIHSHDSLGHLKTYSTQWKENSSGTAGPLTTRENDPNKLRLTFSNNYFDTRVEKNVSNVNIKNVDWTGLGKVILRKRRAKGIQKFSTEEPEKKMKKSGAGITNFKNILVDTETQRLFGDKSKFVVLRSFAILRPKK